ncbi:hypothetical protein JKF63_01642 [Porcisia hertigi]|uniref:Uncharacterized protein n=1 Tax=Porcisia hertigi TaxID=2761500 RepID=A0A836IEN5_9TRYP|nr:hypothetical protein JKF63_01642 [Porcisia hertigi]
MKAATDVLAMSSSSSLTDSLTHTASNMADAPCPSSSITGAATSTSSFNSPRAPRSTPQSSANRCLVRSLLLQRMYSTTGDLQHQPQQSSFAQFAPLSTLCLSEQEGAGDVDILVTPPKQPMRPAVSSVDPHTPESPHERQQQHKDLAGTTVGGGNANVTPVNVMVKNHDGGACHRNCNGGTAGGDAQCPAMQSPTNHQTAEVASGNTCDHEEKQQITTCPTSTKPLHPRSEALTGGCPISYSSNFCTSSRTNNSASNSFCSAPANALLRPMGTARGYSAGASVSSPAHPHTTPQACNGNGSRSGGNAEAKVVPLMLRASLSAYTTREETGTPVTSRALSRNVVGAASMTALQTSLGTLVPSGVASLGSVTPLSSGLNSAHPSFTRPPSGGDLGATNTPVGLGKMRGGSGNSGPGGGIVHPIKGRVLSSPQGARRPDLGTRRTTFQRSISTFSLSEAASSRGAPPPSDVSEESVYVVGKKDNASARPLPPSMPKEMHNFVLGQYRSLQRDVLSHASPLPPASTDPTSVNFQHTRRETCPMHSSAAKALFQMQEEVRLRALQQQHHDMEVIRNGGREQVSHNMKSSVALAGSLSKLRARTRPSISNTAALYPGDGPSCTNLGEDDVVQSQTPKREPEAWHSSKAFMASNAPAASQCPGRKPPRHLKKNLMKGEEIVVALALDSEDEKDVDASNTLTEKRPKQTCVGLCLDGTESKCAGERLASQPQRRRGAAASAKWVERRLNSGSDNDSTSSEDSSFSLSQQRSGRAHNQQPLSFTRSPGDRHHHSNTRTALLAQSSSEGNNNDDARMECCDCCPCRRPQNFFTLCRTNSRSSTSFTLRGEQRKAAIGETPDEHEQPSPRLASLVGSDKLGAEGRSLGTAMSRANSNISCVMEDLENSDDDEPMLSMQSFRRASIQRIR